MQKIERDEKFEIIEQNNPKARAYQEERNKQRVMDELDHLATQHKIR